jgi:7-cyano-7-deazaguanine synthase
MDSATAAYEARDRGFEIYALHASYGQRTADRELECARRIADVVGVGTKPGTTIAIEAPFVADSKTDIAERGVELEVPYEHTWSCYRENEPACGTCDACAFRLQAFRAVGVRDPIEYAERPSSVDGA